MVYSVMYLCNNPCWGIKEGYMLITALSDIHGTLPVLNKTDVVVIAGDFSPLDIQTNIYKMKHWIETKFIDWLKSLECSHVVFIAGNHDFVCMPDVIYFPEIRYEYDFYIDFLKPILVENNLVDKIHYLCNDYVVIDGVVFYGCPDVVGLHGWAFSNSEVTMIYSKIKSCDVLVTHQPPKLDGVGATQINGLKKEFGSLNLLNKIKEIMPMFVFCGHIHEGNHKEALLEENGKQTRVYNVSIKDENYKEAFQPLTVELVKNN